MECKKFTCYAFLGGIYFASGIPYFKWQERYS